MNIDPVLILLTADIRPGEEDNVDKLMAEILPVTRKYDGCVQISAHRKKDEPLKFMIAEKWLSLDHYKKYVDWRSSTGDLDRLMVLMEGPPVADIWPAELD